MLARVRPFLSRTFALVLVGCGSINRFDALPSQPVDLSGSWVLDRAASDDPAPVIRKLRAQATAHRMLAEVEPDDSSARGNGPEARAQRAQEQAIQNEFARRNAEIFRRRLLLQTLQADIARADHLTIRQTPTRFSLEYGALVRSFTPGEVSVVSAEWGVADQSSGWKGKRYVIRIKPQSGVGSEETISLAPDGQHLSVHLHLGGGDFGSVDLNRIYDRSDRPMPREAPTND
jgi:hypothetical protein